MMTRNQVKEKNEEYLKDVLEDGWVYETGKSKESNAHWLYLGESPTNREFTMCIPKVVSRFREGKELNEWYKEDANSFDLISIWARDGLQIVIPEKYSFKELKKNLKRCMECNELVDEVVRIGFAGRYCKKCEPELRPKIEHNGWTE